MKKRSGRPTELEDPIQMNLFVERSTKDKLKAMVSHARGMGDTGMSLSRIVTILVDRAHAKLEKRLEAKKAKG